ncbi:hypothetical protein ACHAXS_011868 [Conticribra weissflogii]
MPRRDEFSAVGFVARWLAMRIVGKSWWSVQINRNGTMLVSFVDFCFGLLHGRFIYVINLLHVLPRTKNYGLLGCLECRGKDSFSDIPVFKPKPIYSDPPCIMRVCAKCLDLATPWVKYDFVCRRLKCNTRLVPSHVIERKRCHTFKSSPLNALPEDGLLAIVDFLSGKDLLHLYLTNSLFCTVAERSARAKVENVNADFPSGPIKTIKSNRGKIMTIAEGTNPFRLRAPEDCKAWVGVLNHLEEITKDSFYFGDVTAASKYLQSTEKFAFGPRYEQRLHAEAMATETLPIVPLAMSVQYPISVTGGLFHVIRQKDDASVSQIAAGSKTLRTGVHRIICRSFFPMPERLRFDTTIHVMGAVGVIRRKRDSELTWAHRIPINYALGKEMDIVALKYDTRTRTLTILRPQNIQNERNRINSNTVTLPDTEGDLMFAAELTPTGISVQNSLLSVRECSSDEWYNISSHSPNMGRLDESRRDRDVFERFIFDAMEGEMNDDERPAAMFRVARHANRRRPREEYIDRTRLARFAEPYANLQPNENLDQNNVASNPEVIAFFDRHLREVETNVDNSHEGEDFDIGFPQDLFQQASSPARENEMVPRRLANNDGDLLSDSGIDWHRPVPANRMMLDIAQDDPVAGDVSEGVSLTERRTHGFAGPVEFDSDNDVIWHDAAGQGE